MIYYIGAFMTYVAVPLPLWLDITLLVLLCCGVFLPVTKRPVLWALAAISLAAVHLWALQATSLPEHLAGKNLILEGRITGLVDHTPVRQRFNLDIDTAEHEGRPHALGRVRLSWYEADTRLVPGQHLRVAARLKPVHGLANPAAFNYERWALNAGIDAQGMVTENPQVLAQTLTVSYLRAAIAAALEQDFSPQTAASLQALVLGHGSALDDSQWLALRHSGTVHLMVVSGLHIGLLIGLVWGAGQLARPLLLRAGISGARLNVCFGLASLLLSGGYVLLAGAGIAAQRAWLMAAVFMLAYLLQLNLTVWQRWWLAMLVVITLQPLAVFAPGFWLSFAAVAVIIGLLSTGVRSVKGMVLRSQLGIFLCMSPVLLLTFGQLAWLAPLVNLVAIPFISLLLIISVPLWGLASLGVPYMTFVPEQGFALFWHILRKVTELGWGVQPLPVFDWLNAVLALIAGVLVLLPLSVRARVLALLAWLLALQPGKPVAEHRPGEFQAWVFDVGQGLAVLIEQGKRRLLFDTGPGFGSWNAYSWAVQPYFEQQGVESLDYLVLSHGDQDHIGGYPALKKHLKVEQLITGSAELFGVDVQVCQAGQNFNWPGVEFRFLAGSQGGNENARSCVLEISGGDCRLLLTGDIDIATEHQLDLAGSLRPVTWLLASHHGSRTGSSDRFLALTSPDWVIFSAGYLNRYQHPHPQVVAAVEHSGAAWLNTATAGAVRLRASESACQTDTWRAMKHLRWQR